MRVTIKEGPGGGLAALSEFMKKADAWKLDLKFDPGDPASVEAAVEKIRRGVDALAAPYAANPAVQSIAAQMKETFEARIRAARHEGEPGAADGT